MDFIIVNIFWSEIKFCKITPISFRKIGVIDRPFCYLLDKRNKFSINLVHELIQFLTEAHLLVYNFPKAYSLCQFPGMYLWILNWIAFSLIDLWSLLTNEYIFKTFCYLYNYKNVQFQFSQVGSQANPIVLILTLSPQTTFKYHFRMKV